MIPIQLWNDLGYNHSNICLLNTLLHFTPTDSHKSNLVLLSYV